MLEAELSSRDDLRVELQRTKDELRDLTEELAVANSKIDTLTSTNTAPALPRDTRQTDISRKSSRLNVHYQGIPENAVVTSGKTSISYTNAFAKPTMPRLSSSRSLRKIHGMLDQMKSLESRVANFKSSLPKPVTPTKLPSSPSRSSSRTGLKSELSSEGLFSQLSSGNNTSSIPVSKFRNSPSLNSLNKSQSHADSHRSPSRNNSNTNISANARPKSPHKHSESIPQRSQSAAGHRPPVISLPPKYETMHKSTLSADQSSNGYYKGHMGRTASLSVARSPKSQKSIDTLFHSMSISESQEPSMYQFEGKRSVFSNTAPKNPNGDQDAPLRPGSAFGMMHSRQPVGHGRM